MYFLEFYAAERVELVSIMTHFLSFSPLCPFFFTGTATSDLYLIFFALELFPLREPTNGLIWLGSLFLDLTKLQGGGTMANWPHIDLPCSFYVSLTGNKEDSTEFIRFNPLSRTWVQIGGVPWKPLTSIWSSSWSDSDSFTAEVILRRAEKPWLNKLFDPLSWTKIQISGVT